MDNEAKIETCPYCGHNKFGMGFQWTHARVFKPHLNFGENLYHIICLNCGSVVRSYVKNPEKFKDTL